jgi:hypothetical protein
MRSLAALTILCALFGCVEEQRYAVENKSLAVTVNTPAAYEDDDGNQFFVVERTFSLPISTPSDSTLNKLAQESQGMNLPFPRLPWVERADIEILIDYTLANLGDTELSAGIRLDGINEFNIYTPGIEDFHQWEYSVLLGPKERVTGTISELQMDEVAIDLATVVNGAPNSNEVVHFLSQSQHDKRVRRYIPKVVPALVAMRFGLITGQAANVVLEISVRVQDHGNRVAERGEKSWELPMPMPFVPVVPMDEEG